MDVLSGGSMKWTSKDRVSPETAVITPRDGEAGTPEASAPVVEEARIADKPMMVFITDGAVVEGFDKLEKVVFTEDKILIGSRAFSCIKLSPEQAAKDKLLANAGKETPRIVFVTVDYKDTTVIEGSKLSVNELWKVMQAQYKKAYEGNLETMAKSMLKVLIEFDKIGAARKVQEDKELRETKPSDGDKAEWAKTKKELDERQAKAEKERDALLKFEKKKVKAAAA
jgi:hypothetical protein